MITRDDSSPSVDWLLIIMTILCMTFFSLFGMHFIVARLHVFNYSCHSVRLSCWIKRLLTTIIISWQVPTLIWNSINQNKQSSCCISYKVFVNSSNISLVQSERLLSASGRIWINGLYNLLFVLFATVVLAKKRRHWKVSRNCWWVTKFIATYAAERWWYK